MPGDISEIGVKKAYIEVFGHGRRVFLSQVLGDRLGGEPLSVEDHREVTAGKGFRFPGSEDVDVLGEHQAPGCL